MKNIIIALSCCLILVSCGGDYRTEKQLINGGREWALEVVMLPEGEVFSSEIVYDSYKFLSFRYSGHLSMVTHGDLVMEIWDENGFVDRWNWEVCDGGTRLRLFAGDFEITYLINHMSKEGFVLTPESGLQDGIKYRYIQRGGYFGTKFLNY